MGEVYNELKGYGFEYVNESEIVNIMKIRKIAYKLRSVA